MGTLPFEAAAAATAEQHFAKRRRALANETRALQAVEGKGVNMALGVCSGLGY